MQPVDVLVDATVDAVADAGMAESIARMGTVAAVNSDGTVTVTLAEGDVPKVRLLRGLYGPAVGDVVEVLRTRSGWVCLGRLATTSAPTIQSGLCTTPAPGTGGGTTDVAVAFPRAFSGTPRLSLTPESTVPQNFDYAVMNVTSTGFTARCVRTTNSTTTFHWIATTA